jgi:hypothetical protein
MSQSRSNVPLFWHGQNHIDIKKLMVLETGLGTENTAEDDNQC